MKNNISVIVDYKIDVQSTDKFCGICNIKIETQEELSRWIRCDSCEQVYHGNHVVDQLRNGFCCVCKKSLIAGVDMRIYNIIDFIDGELQFQAKTKITEVQWSKNRTFLATYIMIFVTLLFFAGPLAIVVLVFIGPWFVVFYIGLIMINKIVHMIL